MLGPTGSGRAPGRGAGRQLGEDGGIDLRGRSVFLEQPAEALDAALDVHRVIDHAAEPEDAPRADGDVALDEAADRRDRHADDGIGDRGVVEGQHIRPRAGPLGRLGDQPEVAADDEVGPVGQGDGAADVEQVEIAADRDPRAAAAQVDVAGHVESLQVTAGGDRGARQDPREGDAIDRRGPDGLQRAGQLGVLEAFDVPDLAAGDRELPDVEQVDPPGLPVGEAVGEALLLRLAERVDRQLGIRRRAVDDDPHLAARHGVGPDRADRLGIVGVLLGHERCRGRRGRVAALAVRSFGDVRRDRVGRVRQLDHVVRAVQGRHLDGLAAAGGLGRDGHPLPRDAADRILQRCMLHLRRQVLEIGGAGAGMLEQVLGVAQDLRDHVPVGQEHPHLQAAVHGRIEGARGRLAARRSATTPGGGTPGPARRHPLEQRGPIPPADFAKQCDEAPARKEAPRRRRVDGAPGRARSVRLLAR